MKKSILILFLGFLAGLFACVGCQKNELAGDGAYSGMGRIELSLAAGDLISVQVDDETKAAVTPALEELSFTISGVAKGGAAIYETIFFTASGSTAYSYFKAGTYTITATYNPVGAASGTGEICYSGMTEEFTVETSSSVGPLSIEMKPANAKVTVIFDPSLKEFYQSVGVGFTSPREFSINNKDDADGEGRCCVYLEAGRTAAYGVTATPLSNSGASPVSVSGLYLPCSPQGSDPILLEAGKEYVLRIRFAPGGIAVFLDGEDSPVYTTEELWNGLFS